MKKGLRAKTRECTGFTELTPRHRAKDKKQTTPATRKAGRLISGGGENNKRPEPAESSRGMLAGGGSSGGGPPNGRSPPAPAPVSPRPTYPPEPRASGACRSIRAAPTTADHGGDPEPWPDSKTHRTEELAAEVLQAPR